VWLDEAICPAPWLFRLIDAHVYIYYFIPVTLFAAAVFLFEEQAGTTYRGSYGYITGITVIEQWFCFFNEQAVKKVQKGVA